MACIRAAVNFCRLRFSSGSVVWTTSLTKGSDFDMRLINGTKYKVNSMRLTNNMCLTERCA